MNRNVESRFALNPTKIDMSRSRFNMSSSHKTTFNVGEIIPFYINEVLPGDTFNIKTSKVVRMPALITPMMDNIYLDTYYFFVPNRLVWDHWKEFMGENSQNAWIPTVEYSVPQVTAPSNGFSTNSIADYFGIPVGKSNFSVSALPFRAYARIIDEWFRDENLDDPIYYPTGDADVVGDDNSTVLYKGGWPYYAAKYHDYFTSCLPSPQKGPDVSIPFSFDSLLPVVTMDQNIGIRNYSAGNGTVVYPMRMYSGFASGFDDRQFNIAVSSQTGLQNIQSIRTTERDPLTNNNAGSTTMLWSAPVNLWASPSEANFNATINQLRIAFQIQKLYERDARGGTRYIEILKSHFGVTSPDSRLQRSEYLGGNRIPIRINQVVQNSETTSTSPQGNVSGMSLTTDNHSDFTRSFTEHGFVIGLMVARYEHTYQQGIERFWSRKDRFDYFWPVFANIGEMAVLNKEIYVSGDADTDNEVFGYNEAWADYRYKPNRVSGLMRSKLSGVNAIFGSLDFWHLADDYDSTPALSSHRHRSCSYTLNINISEKLHTRRFTRIRKNTFNISFIFINPM